MLQAETCDQEHRTLSYPIHYVQRKVMENKGVQKRMGRGQRDQGCICGGGEQVGGMCLQCKVALMWECFVVGRVQTEVL